MNIGNRNSQKSFATVPQANMARSKFNRSFGAKDTIDFDYLTPIFMDEVLPGDTKKINVKSFFRLAPQVVPLLDNLYIDWYFFFVPNRLVWTNWEKQMGAQEDPGDTTDYLTPQIVAPVSTGFTIGSVFDHVGIPTFKEGVSVNALPFRMYNLIWNEWFRDQNLQNSVTVNKGDGPDTAATYPLLKAAKKHDYFTSALPWPQKGNAVTLPMTGNAPVIGIGGTASNSFSNAGGTFIQTNGTTMGDPKSTIANTTQWAIKGQSVGAISASNKPQIFADLTNVTAITVNQLRQSIMMQSLLELDARGGTRYTEILKAHFNVISPDFRLQRPEFLSSATSQIMQHPIAQTSETTAESPQGNLAAYSTAYEGGNKVGFTKSFVEHGWVIGLMRPRADVTYQYGLNKKWSRNTRWDYFWPKLQELGEQEIKKKEIFSTGLAADNDTWGYQERYAEYRYSPSEIRGQFRSNFLESLDIWHMAEEFGSAPSLNGTFIESSTPIQRSLVVPDEGYPALLCDFFFEYIDTRPIMTYGLPATLGRF